MGQQKTTTDSMSDAFICIIGNNKLQNELLLSYLKETIGLKGKWLLDLEPVHSTVNNESAIFSIT